VSQAQTLQILTDEQIIKIIFGVQSNHGGHLFTFVYFRKNDTTTNVYKSMLLHTLTGIYISKIRVFSYLKTLFVAAKRLLPQVIF
jgi:tRNA nucleotidyltransferase/poly(A) polymerase